MDKHKYKKGDVVFVKLERWVDCKNPPPNGIAKGIFDCYGGSGDFCFKIDPSYNSPFRDVFHMVSNIVEVASLYSVELL